MRIVVIPNPGKPKAMAIGELLQEKLIAQNIDAEVLTIKDEDIYLLRNYSNVLSKANMVICVGGDGTFLYSAREATLYDIPILGVNMGHFGFLTEIDGEELDWAVERIKKGDYNIEERRMIDVFADVNGVKYNNYALNELLVTRTDPTRTLHLSLSINNKYAMSYKGDGLIVATPTGSTAYSLSAGGPIVEPSSEIMVVTPICPHSLDSRPIIVSDNSIVKVNIIPIGSQNVLFSSDGQGSVMMGQEGEIVIKKSEKTVKVVRMKDTNFFSVLKEKMSGGKNEV